MRLLRLLALLAPAAAHVCVHDTFTSIVREPAVEAPPSDGARARRDAVANAAPIRIKAVYAASNGGTDIATEAGMTAALKTVVETAVAASIARFTQLLQVTPVTGNLYAYRQCTSQWTNGRCAAVDSAPTCAGGADDVALPLTSYLGAQTIYPVSSSAAVTLPAGGAGVSGADTVIFITAKQTSSCGSGASGTIAYARYCQRASDDRPTFGRVNVCPSMLPASVTAAGYADLLSTVLHELTHVLAFSSSLFPYFRDDAGVPRTARDSYGYPADIYYQGNKVVASGSTISYANERGMDCSWGGAGSWVTANIPYGLVATKDPGDCVARISTPRVKAAARAFFNCDTLEGAELENQDTSAGFVQGSHWEARTLGGEFMAAYSAADSRISPLTLAVFEDSGWYKAVYPNADPLVAGKDYGYKQGCAFAAQKCSSTNTGSPPHFNFAETAVEGTQCTVDRSAIAYTATKVFTTTIPSQYRYFADAAKGGTSYADYCPTLLAYSNGFCTSTATESVTYGSVVGASSRCHVTTLNKVSASPTANFAQCYAVTCASNGQSYTLTTKSGAVGTCTADGATISISGYGGAVTCGSPAAVCGAGETWPSLCAAGYGYDAALATCVACPAGFGAPGGVGAVCVPPTPSPTQSQTATGTGTPSATQTRLTVPLSDTPTPPNTPSGTPSPPTTPSGTPSPPGTVAPSASPTGSRSPSITPSTTPAPSRKTISAAAPVYTVSIFLNASAAVTALPADVAAALCAAVAAQLGIANAFVTIGFVEPVYGSARRLAAAHAGSHVVFAVDAAAAAASPTVVVVAASLSSSVSAAVGAALFSIVSTAVRNRALFAALPPSVATAFGFSSVAALSAAASVDAPVGLVTPPAAPAAAPASSPLAAILGGTLGGAALLGVLACAFARHRISEARRIGGGARAPPVAAPKLRGESRESGRAARAPASARSPLESAQAALARRAALAGAGGAAAPYADFTRQGPQIVEAARAPRATFDALLAAVSSGDARAVRALLTASPALALASAPNGMTAAAMAARKGQPGAFAELLRAGADARAVDVRGLSLLHHAALGKSALVTQQALEAGADLHAVDGNGKRALDVAVMFGADDVEAVLAAAESRYADFTKVSPLVAETPAAPPVAPTPPPPRAREPPATLDALVAAVTGGDVALVRALLAASPALATAASPSGVTAAAMAARKGRTDALAVLLRAGADARAVDVRGLSLLHHAALGKSPRAATLALEAGADVFAVDVNGKSASDVAAIFGAAEVADVLTAAEAVA